jgi:hypothetical protein
MAGLYATAGIAIGFGAAAYAGVKANSDTQQFLATMTKLTGSTEQAKIELQNLKTFAAQTPFEMGDLKQGELIMRAVGLETGKWRTAIGDTAAAWKAAGKNYSDVVQAIADSQTGELERLKEFGITKQQIVDKGSQMFKNKELVNKKGQITDMARFNEALLALMQDRYGGMMAVQSKTFAGMLSNVKDFGTAALETLSKPLFDKLNMGAKSAMEGLQELQQSGTLEIWAEAIGEDIDSVIGFFKSINWQAVGMVTQFAAVSIAAYSLAAGIRVLALSFAGLSASNIVILSLSAMAGVVALLDKETTRLSLATIKQTQSQLQQVTANDQLINSYESLRNQSKWTNDEFLRYLDLQKMIAKETDTSKIQQYKNEMDGLQKNSGLTNKQIQQLINLNGQMVKKMPEGSQAISSQGSAVAKLTDSYRRLNAEKRVQLQEKLEEQRVKLLAEQPLLIDGIRLAQKEANKADAEAIEISKQILQGRKDLADTEAAAARERKRTGDSFFTDDKIREQKNYIAGLGRELEEQTKIRDVAKEKIVTDQGRLTKLQQIQEQLGQIAVIEGKTAQDQINKNNQKISQLQTMKSSQKGNTAEIDAQITKLQTENGQLQGTVTKANALTSSLKNAGNQTSTNSKNQGTHNSNLTTGAKNAGSIAGNISKAGSQTSNNIGLAASWNSTLGKPILKRVSVTITETLKRVVNNVLGVGGGTANLGRQLTPLKRHSGGTIPLRVPGIGGDVPAILKGGETVLTARHTNDLIRKLESGDNRGGNGPNLNVTVNNNGGREMDESGVMREAQRAVRMMSAWR